MMTVVALSLATHMSAGTGQEGIPPASVETPSPEAPKATLLEDPDGGRVVLNCAVRPDGTLTDCRIEEEQPAGVGFGEAALRVASQSRVSAETARAASSDSRVRFTTRFRLDD